MNYTYNKEVETMGQMRHSKSDPLINSSRNGCKRYIDTSEANQIDTNLLYPNWLSTSTTSLASMDSTISAEDLINEMVTIEGLRTLYNSCFICGVSWHQNHVTLDCSECGGYAMSRSCPECDGKCGSQWQRNLTASHENHKAIWTGVCKQSSTVADRHESSNQSSKHQTLIASLKV